ncbi:ABC transporter substrate-binding protein [Bradyrhizobium canariense]|uniref:ABC transporter substrate-binding protein n=1 Tax=Bradyrhizobium canariense TaxID=255045 RepID=UPI000A197B37|nr:ABC transporter substrate-binding protein [Bradyrhizobium canariense]OSI22501.1 ABC transporter substrate-binding protein [Bradyrhizobium canariense]OSI28116.1 ABC transporter substrate-binding protein [Bradyrhizobium canariense]OSI46135.1 ABC transporter substrate-binding protein [Bradyrhizobium canariense]OSI48454.1 ABC transporter substrate-binding protein [Bradyrhizobium canariense]OSI53491.1 ABC transporter substrate-binding protein [Bradyrhizobium canariense]
MNTNRRDLLLAGACAATTALFGIAAARLKAEESTPPPETTTIHLAKNASICIAPQYVVSELLNAEGFTNVVYVESDAGVEQTRAIAKGDIDFTLHFSGPLLLEIDRGASITVVAGVHVGCFELFAREGIRSVADLKGRTVGQQGVGSSPHVFISAMATLVGLDPAKDIEWVTSASVKPIELFAEGKIDAFLGFPPEPQRLRAKNIGHVIVNSAQDRPWSQYFCCMLAGNREFVRKNPIATKRVVRAMLRATDLCVSAPALVAQRMVDGGFTPRHDYAAQTLADVPYNRWREFDPEDTIRFYALRLREARMLKSNPTKIIADAADWRFLNEVRRELGS